MKKTSEQLMAEIATVKETLKASVVTLTQLSTELHNQSRRDRTASTSAAYATTANGWLRFAGMITQGLRRADLTDRHVERAKEIEAQEAEILQAREAARARRAAQKASQVSSIDDLLALYGENVMKYARE